MKYIVALVTASSEDEAQGIAHALVSEKLAACANIIKDIRSIYFWDGKVQDDSEVLLVIKTRAELFDQLKDRVIELHSYDVPEVIALDILNGSSDYLSWISESTRSEDSSR